MELRRTGQATNQAFVAMWFDRQMDEAFTAGIEPALRDAGYDPYRIDRTEQNNRIDDEIIAAIRRSGLLVADFTGSRGGVYFEAGFAMGLGIPVFWTVRSDSIASLHFDTRQYPHVVWDTPADLREKLSRRVLAVVGRGTSPPS